jgi:hypothetical protein
LNRREKLRRIASIGAAAGLIIYFWKFTHISLRTGLGHDDLMNIFFAWREPFSDVLTANLFFRTNVIRPFGALFYSLFFDWFALDGFPYRVFLYAVLWMNVGLTYLFVRRVTNSAEIAVLSVLLHCYHAHFFPLYYGSGFCYDVLAFFFYYSAFTLAIWSRPDGRYPGVLRCALLAVLTACGMNSKEAAVSLPAMLLVYELIYHPPRSLAWIWTEARGVVVTGLVSLLYLWARFTGPNNLLSHPAYQPVFTAARFLESTASYMSDLLYRSVTLSPKAAFVVLACMLAAALVGRSRHLLFAWLVIVIGSVPIALVPPRGLPAYYIALVGVAMFFAVLLVRARELAMRRAGPVAALLSQAALFVLVFALLWGWNIRHMPKVGDHWEQLALINHTVTDFRSHPEWFRSGSSILIVNDPFPEYEWATSFIALLVGNDKSIRVNTLVKLDPKPTKEAIAAYRWLIGYRNGRYIELDRSVVP